MRPTILTIALAGIALVGNNAAHAAADNASGWTYTGTTGPAHWPQISKAFHTCGSGTNQSPIDVRSSTKASAGTARLRFSYGPVTMHLQSSGHVFQFTATPGTASMTMNDTRYRLIQLHFHSPGEERFAGSSFPMDMHLVHSDANGKLLVVAVQFVVGDKPNPSLDALLNDVPKNADQEKSGDALLVNPFGLLPTKTSSYFKYSGSLTTPPCTEGVIWVELKKPVTISRAQLDAMRNVFAHNQRPVQPINGREILEVD